MTTLRRERIQKFREIICKSEIYMQCRLDIDALEDELSMLVAALADASLSRTELKTDELQGEYKHTHYQSGEQERPDKVSEYLKMVNFPNAKKAIRVDNLLSAWAVAFTVKTTAKDWNEFAKYAIDMQDREGWNPEVFIEWVKKQEGYPTYWSRKRMEENYPKAYEKLNFTSQVKTDENGIPETY